MAGKTAGQMVDATVVQMVEMSVELMAVLWAAWMAATRVEM